MEYGRTRATVVIDNGVPGNMAKDYKAFVRDSADFRKLAKDHLEAARTALKAEEPHALFYCALELRKAVEALIYESSKAYLDDLPEVVPWQPAKLLALLRQIDPLADASGEISFAPANGDEQIWHSLGRDDRLSLAEIKQHYDALASYLHTPTLEQMAKGKVHDLKRLRDRCERLIPRLQQVIASKVHSFNINISASHACENCGELVKGRVPPSNIKAGSDRTVIFSCFSCVASYSVRWNSDKGAYTWLRRTLGIACPYPDCGGEIEVWERSFNSGATLKCAHCEGLLAMVPGIAPLKDAAECGIFTRGTEAVEPTIAVKIEGQTGETG